MTKRMYMVQRYKFQFSPKWRFILCTSLVVSFLEYCLPIWGILTDNKMKRINNILLKTANNVIFNKRLKRNESKIDVFEKLNWLLMHERLIMFTLHFVHKNVICKSSLNECMIYFERREKTNRSSRQENDFVVPAMKTEFGKSAFFYRSILLWNKLPNSLKLLENFVLFDVELRKYLLKNRQSDLCYF